MLSRIKMTRFFIHYNPLSQVDYVEDAAHNRTTFTYDQATGRKLTETNSDNKVTRYDYNNHAQVIRTWGDVAEPVEYVYDDYDRRVEMHTFKQGTGWNAIQWPAATTGPAEVTKWHYDEATGLLMSKEYDDGKEVSYTYATGGKLETRQWARLNNGNPLVTTYGYDPNSGELTSIDYSDNTQDIAFTYDRLGRQKTITDAVGSRVFGYNNQLQQETETITGLYNKVITRTYETAGIPGRSTGFNLGAGYTVTYGYEAGTGRFRSVDWSAGGQTGNAVYGYLNNSDLIEQLTINNSLLTKYTYEPNRNLKTQVKNEFNTRLISQYDYNYNNLGLRGNVNTSGEVFVGIPIEPTAETNTYNTNTLNQYTQITKDNGQQTTDTLTYDDDGILASIASGSSAKLYKYNAENRLVSVEPTTPTNGDKKVEFVYDYMGRRVQKKVFSYNIDHWSLITDTLFIYDGWNLIQELNTSGIAQKSYVWGLDVNQSLQDAGGIGGLLSVVDTGEAYNYLYDANGNVGQLIDADDGAIIAHYEYDPFGILLKSYGAMKDVNPFKFSTKYYDTETDLYYYGYRFYSTSFGRWINRDPLGEFGGYNLYGFVNNDPIKSYDILGLWTVKGVLKILCCSEDRHIVDEIAKGKRVVLWFDKMFITWKFPDGSTKREKSNARGRCKKHVIPIEIHTRKSLSNKEAASNLAHETYHIYLHDLKLTTVEEEVKVRIETEKFRKRHSMTPILPEYRNRDNSINEKAIRSSVKGSPAYTGNVEEGTKQIIDIDYDGTLHLTSPTEWYCPQ